MANFIQNIELPKDDSRCAHILRTVINNLKEKENESRSAHLRLVKEIRFML